MNTNTKKSFFVDTKMYVHMVIVYQVKCKYRYQEVDSVDTKNVATRPPTPRMHLFCTPFR